MSYRALRVREVGGCRPVWPLDGWHWAARAGAAALTLNERGTVNPDLA